jgi:hypothetical protein
MPHDMLPLMLVLVALVALIAWDTGERDQP